MELSYIVIAFTLLQVSVNCSPEFRSSPEPVEEVVSIYGENFETPEGREPYFINVYRCINKCDIVWPKPSSANKIEIVVPDINTKGKYYKYIVYNHTACACTKVEQKIPRNGPKLHKKVTNNEVNETEFKAKVSSNPINLRSCNFCDKPQPRYMQNKYQGEDGVHEDQKYILFHQCFPGCMVNSSKTVNLTTLTTYQKRKTIPNVSTDIACSPLGINITPQSQKNKLTATVKLGQTTKASMTTSGGKIKQEKESGLLIYIASPKVFLAAFVLSVLLVSILIVDFNLCHRRKGMMYTVFNCRKDNHDNTCPACVDRRQKVIEIV